jgi:hypothetical protein
MPGIRRVYKNIEPVKGGIIYMKALCPAKPVMETSRIVDRCYRQSRIII